MSRNSEKEAVQQLLGSSQDKNEMSRKSQQKRDLKMWSDISLPISLKDSLARLTKDDLSQIRRHYQITGVSQLKKGDLIEVLQSKIPDLVDTLFLTIDQERYEMIQKALRHEGVVVEPNLTNNQMEYFRNCGILFPGMNNGKKVLAMPEEWVKILGSHTDQSKWKPIIRRNTEWIKLTHGLLYYYGSLTLRELLAMLKKYTKKEVPVSDYLSVIDHAHFYYEQIMINDEFFSNIRVLDPNRVKIEHQKRKSLDFYPFSKEQLIKAGEPNFVDRNESYQRFVQFLRQNYEISREDADSIAEECQFAIRIGEGPGDILRYLHTMLEFEGFDTINACMEKIVHLMNHTREWFLKGYTPNELVQVEKRYLQPSPIQKNNVVDIQSRRKIGRNEPCPCGSGKKYKKCCGK
jgi:SEC-C motif